MSRGPLIAVVGASGVGKDTLIRAMVAVRPGLRRVITRPIDADGEGHEAVSEAEFAAREVFAVRLAARGREAGTEIDERLEGADQALPEGVGPVLRLDTDAPVERLARRALKTLYPVRGRR